jgi:hypothetical protein
MGDKKKSEKKAERRRMDSKKDGQKGLVVA